MQAFLFGKDVDDYEYPEDTQKEVSDTQLDQWRKLGPLGKLHNIVTWIMRSPQRTQAFKAKSDGLIPRRDNGTRWNSWFYMLDWAIQKIKQPIITTIMEEPDLSKDLLNAEDWSILQHIRNFLLNFHHAIKATEGRCATLDGVLPTMDFLLEVFIEGTETYRNHPHMHKAIQAGYTKLLTYWNRTERSPAYIAGIVLNPIQKWSYFSHWEPDWQPNMKPALQKFWESSYRSSTGLPERPVTPVSKEYAEVPYHQWMARKRICQTEVLDELDRYINEPLIPLGDEAALT